MGEGPRVVLANTAPLALLPRETSWPEYLLERSRRHGGDGDHQRSAQPALGGIPCPVGREHSKRPQVLLVRLRHGHHVQRPVQLEARAHRLRVAAHLQPARQHRVLLQEGAADTKQRPHHSAELRLGVRDGQRQHLPQHRHTLLHGAEVLFHLQHGRLQQCPWLAAAICRQCLGPTCADVPSEGRLAVTFSKTASTLL